MPELEKGAAFGPYTIEGFIAGGGMGGVYAAQHSIYGTPVAIKVLHKDLHADPSWRARFNEEGVIGQQLKHPNVLSTRELVVAGDRVGLVMDLVSGGQTLSRVMSREFPQGLEVGAAIRLFLGILQGVEYAHSKGVVHGDIKPENVMIQGEFSDPSSWVPMVTDFGTVGLISNPVLIEGRPAVVASPRYASPEHLRGVDHLEPRSDIYALGLMLHYVVSGKHASSARSVEDAAAWVVEPLPTQVFIDLPEGLFVVYRQAATYHPEERFGSCRELALALREVLDGMGETLQLEDLNADLATEVMEERQEMRAAVERGEEEAPILELDATEQTIPTGPTESVPRDGDSPTLTPDVPQMSPDKEAVTTWNPEDEAEDTGDEVEDIGVDVLGEGPAPSEGLHLPEREELSAVQAALGDTVVASNPADTDRERAPSPEAETTSRGAATTAAELLEDPESDLDETDPDGVRVPSEHDTTHQGGPDAEAPDFPDGEEAFDTTGATLPPPNFPRAKTPLSSEADTVPAAPPQTPPAPRDTPPAEVPAEAPPTGDPSTTGAVSTNTFLIVLAVLAVLAVVLLLMT